MLVLFCLLLWLSCLILQSILTCLGQGSKFKFEFRSTCATRCKFLGALPKS